MLIAFQVLGAVRGMLYLHDSQPPIIHSDLKSPKGPQGEREGERAVSQESAPYNRTESPKLPYMRVLVSGDVPAAPEHCSLYYICARDQTRTANNVVEEWRASSQSTSD